MSGGAALDKRPGLRRAVAAVGAGEAEVVVVAYLDRLVRSLPVRIDVVGRVEAAGGEVLIANVGRLSKSSAASKLSGHMLGLVSEYQRNTTAERTHEAKQRAIDRGVPPFPNIPPGLQRREDRTLEPEPEKAPVVAEAFRLRASGATVMEVRAFLAEHGIRRTFHGTMSLLANRLLVGELHFGSYTPNLNACAPIIDRETFNRVQRMSVPRGRRASSDRLLARLGVLRCGTCGSRMVVGTSNPGGKGGKGYPFYRCPPVGDCPRRVTIGADKAEAVVIEAVQAALEGVEGAASIGEGVEQAARELDQAQAALDAAIRAFEVVMDEPTARERLAQLREARDVAQEHLDRLTVAHAPAVTVTAGDWDKLTIEERRALITAVVASATVAPGSGDDRVTVQLLGE